LTAVTAEVHTVRSIREQLAALLGAGEARALLAAMLDVSPSMISLQPTRVLDEVVVDSIHAAAARRHSGEPLAYCVGKAAFRHLVLDVDSRVLIPRPETEILVDAVLRISTEFPGGTAVDLGTGSGAIALSLASEGHFDRVIATDVSADALEVARGNLRHLPPGCTEVEFRLGATLAPLAGVRARVLASNPPYIAYDEAAGLPRSVRDWEPPAALFAADGGMAMYSLLFERAVAYLEPQGWLVLEVDSRRATDTAERADRTGLFATVQLLPDLTGRDRVLLLRAAT
jgi:release factor glutamine methyltransferase